jgi:hypothetical protein
MCGTAAQIGCEAGSICRPLSGLAGFQAPEGVCRIPSGGTCSFVNGVTPSFCDDDLVCEFDRATDPQGKHGICKRASKSCNDPTFSTPGCPLGFECMLNSVSGAGGAFTGSCQMVPDRALGDRCGGVGGAACGPGLVCARPSHLLPAAGGQCFDESQVPECKGLTMCTLRDCTPQGPLDVCF